MSENLRAMVRGAYDIQKLRIQMGNRIVDNFKKKLGQESGKSEEQMDKEGQNILRDLRRRYEKITDGVKSFPRHAGFKGDEVISNYTELCLIAEYLEMERSEETHFKRLEKVLRDYPIYTEFLEKVKGVGPAMAGVILSEFDIHKAEYPSSLHVYAGLDVVKIYDDDGNVVSEEGRSKRKEHLVERPYIDKNGEEKTKMGITFNPFLKTKLVHVLASCFLRAGPDKSPYAKIYYDYRNRLEHHVVHKEKTKLHRHNMANRYMIKRFLVDLYNAWRPLEGLKVAPTYEEAKLGIIHKVA